MKKILTITCHNVYNHGATLQEYALVEYLKSKNLEAKSIRYKPNYLSQHYNLWSIANPKFNKPIIKLLYLLIKLPTRLNARKRKKAFDVFEEKFLTLGKKVYKTNQELKDNIPLADAYICGSDQIWNHVFNNGKDPAFYLDFVPDSKLKISYAASIATDNIPKKLVPFYQKQVGRLDYISVREKSAVKLINNIGIENVTQVLDPVFLIEKSYWENTFVKELNEKYIFIYDFDSNPQIRKAALQLKEKFNCKIYTVNQNINYADKNYWDKDPSMFLTLVKNSLFNLSNSFHAVCFSLIFEKDIIVFNRNENINTRMQDLLSLMGIKENLISKFDINLIESYRINYELVNPIKAKKIESSKAFLDNALSKI